MNRMIFEWFFYILHIADCELSKFNLAFVENVKSILTESMLGWNIMELSVFWYLLGKNLQPVAGSEVRGSVRHGDPLVT